MSVKRGTQTDFTCHRSLSKRDEIPCSTDAEKWALIDRMAMIYRLKSRNTSVVGEFTLTSMLTIALGDYDFPFLVTHKNVDVNSLMRYKVMHNLPLGVSRMSYD